MLVVIGAKICEYLLEKSRVTHRSPGETNFHIFHILLNTFSDEQLQKYKLSGQTQYWCVLRNPIFFVINRRNFIEKSSH